MFDRPACLPPELLLVAATFVGHFFSFGPLYAFGVFLPPLKAHFEVSLDAVTAVHSVMISFQFFGSLLAGLLIPRHLSHRTVAAVSSIMVLFGYLLAAWADSLVVLYLAMGPVGLGLGASNLAGITALNARVRERRALAVGIATCGTSVGTILLPPVLVTLISSFGWRVSLRLLGIVTGVTLAVLAPFFTVGDRFAAATTRPHAKPWMDARFRCWWINMVLVFLGYFSAPTLLAQFGQRELGASAQAMSAMYSVIGACALLTRGCLGCITSACGGARRVFAGVQFIIGVGTVLMPWCWNQASLMVWSVIFGLAIGPLIALISVILCELFGTEVLPLYHGFSRFGVGVGAFLGPPAIGFIVDNAGYRVAFAVAGSLMLASMMLLLALAKLQQRHESEAAGAAAPTKDHCSHEENREAEAKCEEANQLQGTVQGRSAICSCLLWLSGVAALDVKSRVQV